MNKEIVYKIVDISGNSIGKQEYYSSLKSAKSGCRHTWRLAPGCKIIKVELTETILSEVGLNLTPRASKYNYKDIYYDLVGFNDEVKDSIDTRILFNK